MINIKGDIRQLFRMAIITSPLIAMYTITTVILFVGSLPDREIFFYFFDYTKITIGFSVVTSVVLAQWGINIWLFYLLDNKRKKKLHNGIKYLISYTIVFVIMSFISVFLGEDQFRKRFEGELIRFYPFIGAMANNTFVLILYAFVTSKTKSEKLEIEKAQLEVSNLLAQREQLKHKIHPHFLFNALNTLKLLIKKNQEQAEGYVVRLSNYLRFSISESVKDTASIQDELTFFENYVELQKVRFRNAIDYEVNIPEEILSNYYLPVFTLQSLAENAIKHNSLTENTPLKMNLIYNEDKSITFENNLLPKLHTEPTTGTGLKNLSERFTLLTAVEPVISKDDKEKKFSVTFKILNKETH